MTHHGHRATRRPTLAALLCLLLPCALLLAACGQTTNRARAPYPERDAITWVVPFAAGGNTDAISRVVADAMSREIGQEIVVENKPGGSGAIGMQTIRAAKPDGYTVGLFTSGTIVVSPLANELDYGPGSFTNIGLMLTQPVVIMVSPDSRYRSFEELTRAAKDKPESVTIGVPGATTPQAYEFTRMAREHQTSFSVVPFNSNAEVTKALMGGSVDAIALNASADVEKTIKSGKQRPIAVGESERLSWLPETPTIAESGFEGLTDSGTLIGLSAPPGMSPEVRGKLEKALSTALTDPKVVALLGQDNIADEFVGSQAVTAQLDQRWGVYQGLVKP